MELETLIIKEMDTQDLDEVLDMERSSSLTPWSRNQFIEEMNHPWAHCFIIKPEGILRHYVRGFICFRNIGEESELFNICVHPQYRQIGIGKRLMQFYIRFCSQRKIKAFYLEVNASNCSAMNFYQGFAYRSMGMRKKYYQGTIDALLMVKRA
jgi:ribosomal-protein-alanine N-acetyltransferase